MATRMLKEFQQCRDSSAQKDDRSGYFVDTDASETELTILFQKQCSEIRLLKEQVESLTEAKKEFEFLSENLLHRILSLSKSAKTGNITTLQSIDGVVNNHSVILKTFLRESFRSAEKALDESLIAMRKNIVEAVEEQIEEFREACNSIMDVDIYGRAEDRNNSGELESNEKTVLNKIGEGGNNFRCFNEEAAIANSPFLILQKAFNAQLVYDFLKNWESSPRFQLEQFQKEFLKELNILVTNDEEKESIFKFLSSKFGNGLKLTQSSSRFVKRNGTFYWFEPFTSNVSETSTISVYADSSSSISPVAET